MIVVRANSSFDVVEILQGFLFPFLGLHLDRQGVDIKTFLACCLPGGRSLAFFLESSRVIISFGSVRLTSSALVSSILYTHVPLETSSPRVMLNPK